MVTLIKQWLYQKSNWWLLASVLLLGLSVPGIGIWPLAWFGLVPALGSLARCTTWKQAWIQGLLWGTLYHGILFVWFLGMHPVTWMGFSPVASLIITALAWGIAALTQGLIISLIWVGSYLAWRKQQILLVIVLPLLWMFGLWFLNQNPIGLPWGFLAYSQVPVDWIRQSAYTLTFWGLETLMVLVNVMLFWAIYTRRRIFLGLSAFTVFLILLVGAAHHPPKSTLLQALHPVAIQGNIPLAAERLFLTEEQEIRYYQEAMNRVLKDVDTTRMILLPEGVITLRLGETTNPYRLPPQVALLSGGVFQTDDGIYNGAILFAQPGIQTFAKRYLVPFGETVPFVPEDWFISMLRLMGIAYSKGFSKAPLEQEPMKLGNIIIGPLICFEALYPNLTTYYQEHQVNLLATFSNLGWFHQHRMLEEQFLAINQMRAAESGVPLLLVTNTGVSAIISERGEILARTGSGKAQFLTTMHAWDIFPEVPKVFSPSILDKRE